MTKPAKVSTTAAALALALSDRWQHFGNANVALMMQDALDALDTIRTDALPTATTRPPRQTANPAMDIVKKQWKS